MLIFRGVHSNENYPSENDPFFEEVLRQIGPSRGFLACRIERLSHLLDGKVSLTFVQQNFSTCRFRQAAISIAIHRAFK